MTDLEVSALFKLHHPHYDLNPLFRRSFKLPVAYYIASGG
jgi:hypothetical protein